MFLCNHTFNCQIFVVCPLQVCTVRKWLSLASRSNFPFGALPVSIISSETKAAVLPCPSSLIYAAKWERQATTAVGVVCVAILGCSHLLFTAATCNAQLTTRFAPQCCAFVWYNILLLHSQQYVVLATLKHGHNYNTTVTITYGDSRACYAHHYTD